MLFKAATSSRSYASRMYQQRRKRQQRMVLLGLALFMVALVSGFAIWGVCQAATRFFQPLPVNTDQFEAYIQNEFGITTDPPSLLYYNNIDYTAFSPNSASIYRNKLMPILPAGENRELKEQLQAMFAEYAPDKYIPHFYFYNPQDNTYVEINGYSPVAAASVIKLPILLDYLLSLDENMLTVDSPLLYAEFHRAGGAGILQYQPTGQDLKANDVAAQMIRISDNTCTNMMISYLGGTDAVNHRLAELGLVHTRIRNWLPDLSGTNTISPYEMVSVLYNIDHGPLISQLSRYNGLDILKSTHNRRLLVAPLPQEATVAHKTGDIGTAIGDSGIVYLPDGRRYFISMQVERPFNDYTVRDMVQRASRMVYDYVSAQAPIAQTQTSPNEPTTEAEPLKAQL